MVSNPKNLFSEGTLKSLIAKATTNLLSEIDSYDKNYILNVNVGELCHYLEEKYSIHPPKLRIDDTYILEDGDVNVDVSQDPLRLIDDRCKPFYIKGTFVTFAIPFDGDGSLFSYSPSTFTTGKPYGYISVEANELHITVTSVEQDSQKLRGSFDRILGEIRQHLNWVVEDVERFNLPLNHSARERIEQRRQKLLKDQSMTAALGFPIKRRENAPQTYNVPIVRHKLPVQRPSASTEPYTPEPELEMKEYEHILNVISNMVQVMERSPHAFSGMEEEDLRNHFLVQLNGQYEGQATGETFNFEGKTDILIRANGRNIFIAECKFWKGPEKFLETIDQLLGYANWRDTKTAIILFNRNKNLSAVVAKVPETVKSHSNFKRQLDYSSETGFRFIIHQRDDNNREILLTVMIFDVPK